MSISLDTARELASRFGAWLKYSTTSREDRPWSPGMPTLSPHEREQLFAWVRARLAAEVEAMLGVWAECGGHGITDDEAHEALSHAVKMDLELSSQQALALCVAVGWPS